LGRGARFVQAMLSQQASRRAGCDTEYCKGPQSKGSFIQLPTKATAGALALGGGRIEAHRRTGSRFLEVRAPRPVPRPLLFPLKGAIGLWSSGAYSHESISCRYLEHRPAHILRQTEQSSKATMGQSRSWWSMGRRCPSASDAMFR